MNKIKVYSLLWLFFTSITILQAQDSGASVISADRTGGTARPTKIDKGVMNFEFGANYNNYNKKNFNINGQNYAGMLRYGLLENLELNMGFGIARVAGDGFDNIRGLSALSTGAKIGIAKEDGAIPRIEFEGRIALPWFGKKAFRPGDAEPNFNFNFANTINDLWTINYAVGMFWEGGEEAGYYGFMLTHNFSPQFRFFAEHYGNIRGDVNLEPHIAIGLMYLVNDKLQIDFSIDAGRDDGAVFTFFDIGLATMLISGE